MFLKCIACNSQSTINCTYAVNGIRVSYNACDKCMDDKWAKYKNTDGMSVATFSDPKPEENHEIK